MQPLNPQFSDAALPTLESFIKHTKTARLSRRAQAVCQVVTGQRLLSVRSRAVNGEKLGHIRRMSPCSSEVALVDSSQEQAKSRSRSESIYPCWYRVSATQVMDFMVLTATLSREPLLVRKRRCCEWLLLTRLVAVHRSIRSQDRYHYAARVPTFSIWPPWPQNGLLDERHGGGQAWPFAGFVHGLSR